MTTFTIIALLITSLTLLAWVGQLIQKTKDQQYSIDCYKLLHETAEDHAMQMADEVVRIKEELNPWIESLQKEVLDFEELTRDLENETHVRKAEIDQLKWNLSTYEAVCNPNTEVEDELAIARQCIWDKDIELSSTKFLTSLAKERLIAVESKLSRVGANRHQLAYDLRVVIASLEHDEIPF